MSRRYLAQPSLHSERGKLETFDSNGITPLIDSLVQFIGVGKVKNSVSGWRNACSKSRKLTKGYFLEQSFPWWRAFDEYWDATGKHTKGPPNLTTGIVALAKDAQVVQAVVATMPATVKARIASALGSRENAAATLFEISVAHQFLKLGYTLAWCEDDGTPMPEFIATKGELAFEVECKRLSFDTGRHITRVDFCQLADLLELKLRRQQRMGRVEITLNDRLTGKPQDREKIVNDIAKATAVGEQDEMAYSWGTVNIQLQPYDDCVIDFPSLEQFERESKHQYAQMVVTADNQQGAAVNPLVISAKCRDADDVLKAAYAKLSAASRRQLSGEKPGVLCLFLPEISDFQSIADAPNLLKMVDDLFESESRSHLSTIVFSSHDRVQRMDDGGLYFDKPALVYRNSKCRFPEAAAFRYLTEADATLAT
jgi:hypothetical protein